MTTVPYFAQFESRLLVADILAGRIHPANDPLWHASGAIDSEEYARWCDHICGMACLKMLLAQTTGQVIPTIELMKQCREYGGYVVQEDGTIKGLFYRPFVSYVKEVYGLMAEVKEHTPIEEIVDLLGKGFVYIASVHPSIRTPEVTPPRQGGHLVYVFDKSPSGDELIFHNPSGHSTESQENVRLPLEVFARYYAGRGMLINLLEKADSAALL